MAETVENTSDIQSAEDENSQQEKESEENMLNKQPRSADDGAPLKLKKENFKTELHTQPTGDKKTVPKSNEENINSGSDIQPTKLNPTLEKQMEEVKMETTANNNASTNEVTKCNEKIEKLKSRLLVAKESGDRTEEAHAYCDLGRIFDKLGDFKHALEYHRLELQIAKDVGDSNIEGCAYFNLGISSKNLGAFEQAIEYHTLALNIAKEQGCRENEAMCYDNIAAVYKRLRDFEKAIEFHKCSLNIAKEEGNREQEGKSCNKLGIAYQNLGNLKQAEEYHKTHQKIAKEMENSIAEGRACSNLGIVCSMQGNYKQAIDYHMLDLQFAKEGGDRAGEGRAYGNLAMAYQNLSNFKEAIRYNNLYLCIAKETADRAGEGEAYQNLGIAHDKLCEFKQGFEYHKLFLLVAKEIGDRAGEGDGYCSIGNSYLRFGDLNQAIDCHKMDLQIAKELKNKTNEARACCNLGIAYELIGNLKEALDYNKLLLQVTKELGHKPGEARAYCHLGTVYYNFGDYKQSIDNTLRCLDIAKEMRSWDGVERAYCNLGLAYDILGEYEQAIKYHKLNLDISRKLGDEVGEERAYATIGCSYRRVGDLKKAIHYHKQALHIATKLGDRRKEGGAYHQLGTAYYLLLDYDQAKDYNLLSLSIARELGDTPGEASAYGNMGNVCWSLGEYNEGLKYHKLKLQLSKEMGNTNEEGCAHYYCGICFEALGLLDDALLSYHSSVKAFNSVRDLLKTKDEWKIGLRNQRQMSYMAILRLLIKQNKFLDALFAAEQGRAQALEDLLVQQYGFEVRAQYRTEKGSSHNLLNYTTSTVLYQAVQNNDINMWVVRNSDSVHFWKERVDFKHFEIKAVTDLKSLIDKVITLISPPSDGRYEDRSLNSLSGRDEVINEKEETPEVETESYPIGKEATERGFREKSEKATGAETEEKAVLKQDTCSKTDHGKETPKGDVYLLLRILYDMTIRPVEEWLRGSELIIFPDGALFLAPFAAFLDSESRYLSESFRIRVAPSLNTLRLISDAPAGYHSTNGALIVGDPYVKEVVKKKGRELVGLLDQLPNAKKEAEMIGSILNCTPLIGKEATKGAVLSKLNTVALVHIAAHGNSQTGEIALTPDPARHSKIPEKEDFMLTMAEVLSVGLRAQLVVLSCCHSGTGSIKAEGVVGIARAFLGAGARSVLVSLWALDDEATLEFMRSFYQKLVLCKNPSKALEQAMKYMRESTTFHAVKYWAPFVLIGDDVTLDCLERLDPELQSDD